MKSIGRSLKRYRSLDAEAQSTIRGGVILNGGLLVVVSLAGHPELFLLWVIAFMTTHMLSTRLRQMAEHAAVPDRLSSDARLNTRTLYTRWRNDFSLHPSDCLPYGASFAAIGAHLSLAALPSDVA